VVFCGNFFIFLNIQLGNIKRFIFAMVFLQNNKKNTIVHNHDIMTGNNYQTFKKLRKKYPVLTYRSFHWEIRENVLHIQYYFNLADKFSFYPTVTIPLKNWSLKNIEYGFIKSVVFNIGMVELISYWKAACPSKIHIVPVALSIEEQVWWKKLFYLGLGEFFHVNGIEMKERYMLSFTFEKSSRHLQKDFRINLDYKGVVVPVGGGKDSLTSLSVLQNSEYDLVAMAINPGKATLDSVKAAGLENSFLEIKRTIDPDLIQLNASGFLNGHTPFSAIVAFVSLLATVITGKGFIALSNESSANEATIPGTQINHQYSKSFQFETDFRNFVRRFISPDINYFSLLRPLNELQIASIFSKHPDFLSIFRSCNVGSKTNSWCCSCPKCLFTFIMLSSFIDRNTLKEIFGEDLFENSDLIPILDQLSGLAKEKPFECIGTIEEVNTALSDLTASYKNEQLPVLLKHHKESTSAIRFSSVNEQLKTWNPFNNLYPGFEKLLRNKLGLTNQ
jgi:UDP-N-acetyl-alpha-D-muramoyl-L-alanyl-L-glutamate epimerase